jgi:DNA-binding NtrC family response regulator
MTFAHDASDREELTGAPDGAGLDRGEASLAHIIWKRSVEAWGVGRATFIVGNHARMETTLERAARFARSQSPVLITGETGTGKELFARAIYLLSPRFGAPFLSINCAQYQEGHLIASELFGHRRGAFTGAVTDHRGVFEAGDGGVVFLDEVGELSRGAQSILLRLLSEGEIVPVGDTRPRRVDVRVVVATNRNLKQMVEEGSFRADLYYRLRYLHLTIPPVRERGDDWQLLLAHYLDHLAAAKHDRKKFSEQALCVLGGHDWPGNVREIRGLVDTGFCLSEGPLIEPRDFAEALEGVARDRQFTALQAGVAGTEFERLANQEGNFWDLVQRPYLDRDLKRAEVREILVQGLKRTGGSYKRLLALFGVAEEDYLKFMDFLRHHRLKPDDQAWPRPLQSSGDPW